MRTRTRVLVTLGIVSSAAFFVQQAAARDRRPVDSPAAFSIVVNATGPGLSAVCDEGCTWEGVSATYPGRSYRITEDGIHPVHGAFRVDTHQPDRDGFSIVLTTGPEGIRADCTLGCSWRGLSAGYPSELYHITQHGVEPVP